MPLSSNHRPSGEGGQGLSQVLDGDLVPLLDRHLGTHLYRLVRKLDKASIGQAGVVDVAEHWVEAHLFSMARTKLHFEAVDHEDADQPDENDDEDDEDDQE